jgi:hypothetical protein
MATNRNILSCGASKNMLNGKFFGGFRIGVVDFTSEETFTFINTKANNITQAEAFAVLKAVEVAIKLEYTSILIRTYNMLVANDNLTGKAKRYMQLAKEKPIEFELEWLTDENEKAAIFASKQKIEVTPKSEWI